MTRYLSALFVILMAWSAGPCVAQTSRTATPACSIQACWTSQEAKRQYERDHGCSFDSHQPACLIAQGACGQEKVAQYDLPQIKKRLEKVADAMDDPKQAATCTNQKSGLEQIVEEMTNAFVSGNVYANDAKNLPKYIKRISNNDTAELNNLGLVPKDLEDDSSSFYASVYFNNRTQKYIVANRGTKFQQALNPLAQDNSVITDVRQALGYPTRQYDNYATKLAKKIKEKKPTKPVGFTGHSLGGGLAALEATIAGGTAMTFDAAGVSASTLKRDTEPGDRAQSIQNYYTHGEILNQIQGKTLTAATACARRGPSVAATVPMLHYIAWYAEVDYDQGINAVLPTALGSQNVIPLTTWNAAAASSEKVVQPRVGTCLGDLKSQGANHMLDPLLHGLNYQLTQLLCH